MRTQHPICSTICLTLLLCSLLLGYTSTADAQKVHACLILLGNDTKIRESVDINEDAMIGLMETVSRNAEVHMTVMKSEPGRRGEVRNMHLVNTTDIRPEDSLPKSRGIIKPVDVTDWIGNLKVGASDTVLVYFNGHGKMNRYGTHQLLFDKTGTTQLARDVVLEALEATPCRLKLLITDTCSQLERGTRPADGDTLAKYGDIEAKPQFYAQNLFLEHTGTLDITATSPDRGMDEAYGDGQVGGFFTYALTTALVPDADTNGNDFLSWEEAFAATVAGTKRRCETQPLLKAKNIIQKPVAHTLPMRAELDTDTFDGGDGSVPPQHDGPMVLIPAGKFQRGYEGYEGRQFYLDAFQMDAYEVTNEQYKAFVDANPEWQKGNIPEAYHSGNYLQNWIGNDYPSGKGKHPVTEVSWYAAMAYAQWVGKRLPTEAEWEKAARGGLKGKMYPWGNSIDITKTNCFVNYIGDTTPVGKYKPNGYGLYDMSGNVAEWCLFGASHFEKDFQQQQEHITKLENDFMSYLSGIKFTKVCGGSWASGSNGAKVSSRWEEHQDYTSDEIGFRCVKPASP